jgi:hypothetical protein
MKQGARVLILLSLSFLGRPAFIPTADGADCLIECMERSGCWSGRSVSDPAGCSNMQQLCTIQCQGRNNTFGAIAYSRKEKISGWSNRQTDKATAERVAVQACAKAGGAKCVVEASFNNICGAVAADGDAVTWGTAATRASAEQRAMAECTQGGGKKCAVQQSVCSEESNSSGGAPPPPKAISWGAIAYSSRDMGAGWSQGKADRAAAEKEAMNICSQRGKACVLQTAFNKQCGALAADGNFTGTGISTDQRQALQKAIDECKKAGGTRCAPHIMFCSM